MKRILFTLIFAIGAFIQSNAQVKIGYMSPGEVLAQLEEVIAIEQEIQNLIDTRDNQLLTKSTQLQQDVANYEQIKLNLTPDQQQAREQEFLNRTTELENERETYLNEIGQRRMQSMEPILERLDLAINQVAESMELDLVLNQATSYGDAIVFYANEDRLNITNQVLEILKGE